MFSWSSLLAVLLFVPSVHALTILPIPKALEGSDFLYRSVSETFPEFVQEKDGVSNIDLQSLDCYSANEIVDGAHVLKTRCKAIDQNFKISEDHAPALFLTLINLRLRVHNYSSPGITYLNLRNLKCTRSGNEKATCYAQVAYN